MHNHFSDTVQFLNHETDDSALRRYSPLSKLLLVLAFLIAVTSFPRYDLLGTFVFAVFPVSIALTAEMDTGRLVRQTLIALPFVLCAGIANCIMDVQQIQIFEGFSLPGGVLSLLVLLCKTFAAVNIVLVFSACTPFQEIAGAMTTLRIPCIFVLQLQLMFRYLAIIINEAGMMLTAWHLRNPGAGHVPVREWAPMTGHLLLRSINRANAVYQAMQCRLFHAGMPLSSIRQTSFIEHAICIFCILIFFTARVFL